MVIFNHDEALPPEELARRSGASLPLIRRVIAGGCPTVDGDLSYSAFVSWVSEHFAKVLSDFAVSSFPSGGRFSESSEYWILRPIAEWQLHEQEGWLDVGGPGFDGICWALRRGEDGVFAYYPIDQEFIWRAKDAASLISGWERGEISV